MPKSPLPAEFDQFLSQPNPAVIATLAPDGGPHTTPTWYLWESGHALVNMDESRKRLQHLHADPRVSLSVIGQNGWHRHITLIGRAVTIEEDHELTDIDRLSRHYIGESFSVRDRRRVSAWIEVKAWHAWAGAKPWTATE